MRMRIVTPPTDVDAAWHVAVHFCRRRMRDIAECGASSQFVTTALVHAVTNYATATGRDVDDVAEDVSAMADAGRLWLHEMEAEAQGFVALAMMQERIALGVREGVQ